LIVESRIGIFKTGRVSRQSIDMTAGEKERGTMETLLISSAERTEIVAGKFAATTGFAFASVVWNVLWITGGLRFSWKTRTDFCSS
jgi:sodium transport system permease protein